MGRAAVLLLLGFNLRVGCDCTGTTQPQPPLDAGAGELDSGVLEMDSGVGDSVAAFVTAGDYHGARLVGGKLDVFGLNDNGQLGTGDDAGRNVPTRLTGAFAQVAAGSSSTCAIAAEGAVYCWGSNFSGQLGTSGPASADRPTRVVLPVAARSLAHHFNHVCVIGVDASLWCWGANLEGQLGQADAVTAPLDGHAPLRVGTLSDWEAVATGQGHTCAIRGGGQLYCWGRDTSFELGQDVASGQIRTPTRVGTETGYTAVAAGQEVTCALRDTRLYCWAGPTPATPTNYQVPTEVPSSVGWKSVSVNTFHVCAVQLDGALYCWGRNLEGQLGLGDATERPTPALVEGGDWERVAAMRFSTLAQKSDAGTFCFGTNESGQLGLGDFARRYRPAFQP